MFDMTKNIFQKMGPSDEQSNNKDKDFNPNKARNLVITWYSLVAIVVAIYLLVN
tara:strand:- start:309 stop:470 length:162 start_codon:yes stop_codon:yes gene_type:complete